MSATRQSGLTLVEVLVSLAFLGIVSAATVALLPTVVDLNRTASEEQVTTMAAKSFFEDLQQRWLIESTYLSDDSEDDLPSGLVPEACTVAITSGPGDDYKEVALDCMAVSTPFVLIVERP